MRSPFFAKVRVFIIVLTFLNVFAIMKIERSFATTTCFLGMLLRWRSFVSKHVWKSKRPLNGQIIWLLFSFGHRRCWPSMIIVSRHELWCNRWFRNEGLMYRILISLCNLRLPLHGHLLALLSSFSYRLLTLTSLLRLNWRAWGRVLTMHRYLMLLLHFLD